jgi:Zn-dependent protease
MSGFKIITIKGIPIRINYSWFIILFLVVWTLAGGYFPMHSPGLSPFLLWPISLMAALLLFVSILLHELGHSFVALRYGIAIRGITLFIFGGVAQMSGESREPRAEMRIAAAGPLVSFALAALFGAVVYWHGEDGAASPMAVLFRFLAYTNGLLALFNLIPGFPLDGGRILRAVIWSYTGNIRKATLITTRIGKAFAIFLMVYGFIEVLQGFFLNGLWMVFIGLFLQQAAEEGYQSLLLRRTLSAVRVRDIMKTPVVTVPRGTGLETVVNDYFFRYRFNSFPVMSGDELVGMVSLNDVKSVDRNRWAVLPVTEVMDQDLGGMTIANDAEALDALEKMVEGQRGRLVVTDDHRVVGILSQRDIMQAMKVKVDLGGA